MNQITSRKIIAGTVLLITAVLVTYWKGDVPSNLTNIIETLYGAFVVGNAFEHYTVMKTTPVSEKKDV